MDEPQPPNPPPPPITSGERLERAWNQIIQFFPEAFLAVKLGPCEMTCRATDSTWALGAAQRYAKTMLQRDAQPGAAEESDS